MSTENSNTRDAIINSIKLTDVEAETYLRWIDTIPFEKREDGVTFTFSLLPGLGERVSVQCADSELILREEA